MADLVRQAGPGDLEQLAPLFDAYRQFYQQPSDLALARDFLAERLSRAESVVFVAERDGRAVGFVQLYPLFSSTAARPRRLWLLNDLFVSPDVRGGGVGRALIDRLVEECRRQGWARLYWNTRHDNLAARALYDQYTGESGFVRYVLYNEARWK